MILHWIEMAEQNVILKTLEQVCVRLKCGARMCFGSDIVGSGAWDFPTIHK